MNSNSIAWLFPLIILVAWEIIVNVTGVPEIILPAPSSIFLALIDNFSRIATSLAITMFGALLGFIFALVFAALTASMFALSKMVEKSLYPLAVAVKSTPLITIAPLVNLWFGEGLPSKIILSALLAYFPILVAVFDGMSRIPDEIEDLLKSLSASRWQRFYYVQGPYAVPALFSSLKIAAPVAVVGAVIGEYTGATSGIGHTIIIESYYLNTDVVFASILMLAMASFLFFVTISLLEKRLKYW